MSGMPRSPLPCSGRRRARRGRRRRSAATDAARIRRRSRRPGRALPGAASPTTCRAPTVRRRARRSLHHRARGTRGRLGLGQHLRRDEAQHQHRVVRRLAPQRVIELAEHLARQRVPRPPQVGRQLGQAPQASGMAGAGESLTSTVILRLQRAARIATGRCCHRHDRDDLVVAARGCIAAIAAAASARPPPFATWTRSATIRIACAASSSGTTIDSDTQSRSSGHIDSSTDFPPAPSTNDGVHASK